jgi:hypothetical protein
VPLTAAVCITAAAQRGPTAGPAIIVGPSVHVSADAPDAPHVESFLAINPVNPSQLVASSIVGTPGENGAAVYVSRDGGQRWDRASPGVDLPRFSGADPVVYFEAHGAALFGSLCDQPGCGLRVWRSQDGGRQWDSSSVVPGDSFDREYLAVDGTSGAYRNRIYVVAGGYGRQLDGAPYLALAFTFSTDGAQTFQPVRMIDVTGDGTSHGFGAVADPVVTSRGVLVVPIQSSPNLVPGPKIQLYTIVSEDGGRTFSTPRAGVLVERGPAGFRRLRATSNFRLAIDQSSGTFRDRIYATWVDFANDRYEVNVAHSDDVGVSWSPPVTLNDNSGPHDSSNAAIAINRDGIVSVAWNDRRDDPAGLCYRVYATASLDGGETFLPNAALGALATCPNTKGNWTGSVHVYRQSSNAVVLSGAPARFGNGGESQGLVADPDGRFHLAWINGESGVMQLWHTRFTVDPASARVGVRRVDRSKDLSVEVSAPVLDFDGMSIGFTVRLKNRSPAPIAGPFTLVLSRLDADFVGLAATNADNGIAGLGAAWTIAPGGPLASGDTTEPRNLRWRFDGHIPGPQTGLDPFRAVFRVLAEVR